MNALIIIGIFVVTAGAVCFGLGVKQQRGDPPFQQAIVLDKWGEAKKADPTVIGGTVVPSDSSTIWCVRILGYREGSSQGEMRVLHVSQDFYNRAVLGLILK